MVRLKQSLGQVLAFIVLAALVPSVGQGGVEVGDSPALQFRAVDGTQVDLTRLRGRYVVIDFWATWCGPCMELGPHMVELNKKYGPQGVIIIGVSLDNDRNALVQTAAAKGFAWPHHFDGQGWKNQFAVAWGVRSIPATFLIDMDGKVIWKGHAGALEPEVEKVVKANPPKLVDDKTLAAAKALLDDCDKELQAGRPAAAAKALSRVAPAAKADKDTATRVDETAKKLEDWAKAECTAADDLATAKDYSGALTKLRGVVSALPVAPAANDAREKLKKISADPAAKTALAAAEREKRGEESLAAADRLKEQGKIAEAHAAYTQIARTFKDSPLAERAKEAIAELEKDPAALKLAREKSGEVKAKGMLGMAETYRSGGYKDQARAKYQEVLDQFPGTAYADQAQKALADLK